MSVQHKVEKREADLFLWRLGIQILLNLCNSALKDLEDVLVVPRGRFCKVSLAP